MRAIVSKIEPDRLCKKTQVKGGLNYKRREVKENKYHGNILLKKNVDRKSVV